MMCPLKLLADLSGPSKWGHRKAGGDIVADENRVPLIILPLCSSCVSIWMFKSHMSDPCGVVAGDDAGRFVGSIVYLDLGRSA